MKFRILKPISWLGAPTLHELLQVLQVLRARQQRVPRRLYGLQVQVLHQQHEQQIAHALRLTTDLGVTQEPVVEVRRPWQAAQEALSVALLAPHASSALIKLLAD